MFNPAFFEALCPVLKDTLPDFNENDFYTPWFDTTWPQLELKQRVRHIASEALHQAMHCDYPWRPVIL